MSDKLASMNEYVVTAFAEPASGPGWSNRPVWVVLAKRGGGSLRMVCIQPEDQSEDMQQLYKFSALAHAEMRAAALRLLESGEGR